MRLISAASGVQVPAPPPFYYCLAATPFNNLQKRHDFMKFFLTVMGLVLVVEGLPYFAFPEKMQEMLAQIQKMEPSQLRIMGLISMAIGLAICYVVQRTAWFQ